MSGKKKILFFETVSIVIYRVGKIVFFRFYSIFTFTGLLYSLNLLSLSLLFTFFLFLSIKYSISYIYHFINLYHYNKFLIYIFFN